MLLDIAGGKLAAQLAKLRRGTLLSANFFSTCVSMGSP